MREIPLTKGYVALVDDEDYERLSHYRWTANIHRDGVYAKRRAGPATFYLHREVLGLPPGRVPLVDHRNGDRLDCRRSNLRECTSAQNAWNSVPRRGGQFKGVELATGRWNARIRVNYQHIYLGRFDTEAEAALAYDKAARLHFGEFARLNFPDRLHVTNNGDEQWKSVSDRLPVEFPG